ncbi:MAG: hypothetical protein JOZ53_17640, partial [Planctomycetaceae bacterium]|nr:hypothetical protein [Planctomycetaceae bacterium]
MAGLVPNVLLASPSLAAEAVRSVSLGPEGATRPVPHLLWTIPFALLLLAIAVLPLVPRAHHWWE